jgi:hypothetical protein
MIHIKKSATPSIDPDNKGQFTKFCKSKGYTGVTCQCICEALKSRSVKRVKEANFAYNFGFKKNGKTCDCVEKIRKQKLKRSYM